MIDDVIVVCIVVVAVVFAPSVVVVVDWVVDYCVVVVCGCILSRDTQLSNQHEHRGRTSFCSFFFMILIGLCYCC